MIVVTRFEGRPDGDADGDADGSQESFRTRLGAAVAVLERCPGFVDARVGRNIDEPALWVLVSTWTNVGSYRRALSSYDAKVAVVPLLSEAIDEPSAYEPLDGELNVNAPRQLG